MIQLKDIKTYYHFSEEDRFRVDVMILPGSLIDANKPHLTVPHRTDFYHVFLFADSHLTHWADFESIQIESYSLLFIGKGQVHQFDDLRKYKGYELIFTEDFFYITESDKQYLRDSLLFNDMLNRKCLKINNELFDKFAQYLFEIRDEIKQPNNLGKRLILKNLVHNFLFYVQREKEAQQPIASAFSSAELSIIIPFRSLLEQQFKQNKSVVEYAKQLAVSEKKLGQATKGVLGKLPKEMIDEVVLLEAKRLLTYSSLSIKEIGYDLGFDEPTYFTKFFKKYVNQTPIEFKSVYTSE